MAPHTRRFTPRRDPLQIGLSLAAVALLAASALIVLGQWRPAHPAPLARVMQDAGDPSAEPLNEPITDPITGREPEIRVRIARSVRETRVEGVTGPRLIVRPPEGKSVLLTGPLTLTTDNGRYLIRDIAGAEHRFNRRVYAGGIEAGLEIAPVAAITDTPNRLIRIDGNDQPGHARFHITSPIGSSVGTSVARPEALDIIAVMPLEEYVPGVIAYELYQNWPRATFAAQAVAARSYALHQRERARAVNRTYDVESTTRDQVFGGATLHKTARGATNATKGLVLSWEGKLLRAYYSSTCGGVAASAKDTFPTGPGFEFNLAKPLQATDRESPCQDSPMYRWTRNRPVENLAQRLRGWGIKNRMSLSELGNISSVSIESVNEVGRPRLYRVDDDRGKTHFIPAETMRVASNFNMPGLPTISSQTRLPSSHFTMDLLGAEVQFRGQGFGHGVGMCQWGAKGLADQGMDWRSILERYYPGATIARAY